MSIFFVYIEKQGIPKKRHKSIESARAEALRLHTITEGRHAVHVIGPVETLPAATPVEVAPRLSPTTGREILHLKKPGNQNAIDEFAKLIVKEVAAVDELRRRENA